jgi:hypothetical protein
LIGFQGNQKSETTKTWNSQIEGQIVTKTTDTGAWLKDNPFISNNAKYQESNVRIDLG